MSLQALDQCVEGDPAAWTVAQVFVHGDPGFQRQRELLWEDVHDRIVATFREMREMREMRYLWREPIRMDNARLIAAVGQEPHTPLDEAVEATLVGLECSASKIQSSRARANCPILKYASPRLLKATAFSEFRLRWRMKACVANATTGIRGHYRRAH
jgi:hypothetical protein